MEDRRESRFTKVIFAQVDLRLGQILLSGGMEQHVGFLQVAFDAESVAVHDAETVVRLAVALRRTAGSRITYQPSRIPKPFAGENVRDTSAAPASGLARTTNAPLRN
jgi:hypothetical protein